MTTVHYELFSPQRIENPYPLYRELRNNAPFYWSEGGRFWTVTRYDDVVSIARDYQDFSSALGFFPRRSEDGAENRFKTMINSDPPDHGRLRGLVARAFTPRMVAELEPRIRELTRELLDEVHGKGSIDVIQDLAIPLPVTVIAEILGVPTSMKRTFKKWSDDLVLSASGGFAPDVVRQFFEYFATVIEERRREPRADMITTLVQAADGEGQRLTEEEVLAFCLLLLVAGNETTTNLIGNGTAALLANPDQLAYVHEDLSRVPALVEEALRFDGPVQGLFRAATRDVEFEDGTVIGQGQQVWIMYASANRDERHYPEPDRFDVARNPGDHVAFGVGIHFCLGAPLARLEARIAFEEMLDRFADIEPLEGWSRVPSYLVRGYDHMPVRVRER